ncbi:hypothetical protein SEUCBS139899_007095 [Sporothrix eucalyptigena]|uniref:Methyltransferase domain-containing protein n=1 Tax=Sporothrix eucalyptigena TaxID=1812306 RepID=A0ABP0CPS7_9PEZI
MASFAPPKADIATAEKWYEASTTVDGPFRDLLENYSHVPTDDVVKHVVDTRNRAWAVHPYPCLGQFRFLELNLSQRGDLYNRLLKELKTQPGSRFLDIGCCLGQDIRKLVYDGAPASSVAGAELNGAFIDLGYDLFRDRDSTAGQMVIVSANILESPTGPSSPLHSLVGQFSAVQLGMLLHLFTWEEQITAFENTLVLLRGQPGDRIFGQATGHLDGTPTASVGSRATFKHNAESFARLVAAAQEATGTRWRIVTAELDNGLSVFDGKRTWDDPRTRRLVFEIERE